MKTCTRCNENKPLSDFPNRKGCKGGLNPLCRECVRLRDKEYSTTYRKRNPEQLKKTRSKYNRSASKLKSNRKWRFGLTQETLDAMLLLQEYLCGLCRREFSNGETFVDHDHACCPTTGEKTCGKCVRKILCRKCNQGLGYFDDDPELLRTAADYVELHQG